MAQLMLVNPKRRKARRAKRKTVAANPKRRRRTTRRRARRNPMQYANPRRRRTTRRSRRNPKFSLRSIQRDAIMPAAIGGVGALGLDIVFGMLPLPANFKTGAMGSVAKVLAAVALGQIAGRAFGKQVGEGVTVGAVTIQAYNLVKGFARQAMPTLPMGEYLDGALPYYNPQPALGYMNAGEFIPDAPYSSGGEMSEYLSETDYNETY